MNQTTLFCHYCVKRDILQLSYIYKNISFFLFNNNNYFLQKQDDFLIDLQPFSTKLVRMYNYIELFIFSLLLLDFLNKKNCFQISLLYKSSSVFHIGKPELGARQLFAQALCLKILSRCLASAQLCQK